MVKIIAIDGPASVGKSTLAKKISIKYQSPVLFSGKLYRAVALEVIKKKININDTKAIISSISNIDLSKLSSKELYTSNVDNIASIIASKNELRRKLIKFQHNFPKKFAKNKKFAIIEGRDIGTVIFPNADHKIFLWAKSSIRARRRCDQIIKNGKKASYNKIYSEINKRDRKDLSRKIAPLKPAENSVLLDTSYLDIEQAFRVIKKILEQY